MNCLSAMRVSATIDWNLISIVGRVLKRPILSLVGSRARSRSIVLAATYILLTAAPGDAQVEITMTPIGEPIWKPADYQVFSAPSDSFPTFLGMVDLILGPLPDPNREPIDPPHDTLISDGMAAAGIPPTTSFISSDLTGRPNGIYRAYLLLPDPGEIGESRDLDSGPIIPHGLFPITEEGEFVRERVAIDGGRGAFFPGESFDGKSFDFTLTSTQDLFFPPDTPLHGKFEWRETLLDQAGNGWDIVATFLVEFEELNPSELELLIEATKDGPPFPPNPDTLADFLDRWDFTDDDLVDVDDLNFFVTSSDHLNTWIGDANLDGEFNSGDLVEVFKAGQYEDILPGNSTWSTGDWNADGNFDTSDLTAAFEGGGYEMGPRQAVAVVPESSSILLSIAIAGVFCVTERKRGNW